MRIQGVESLERRGVHRILTSDGRVVDLQIAAIPLAVDVTLSTCLAEPQAPYLTTIGRDGKPTGRERAYDDPGFRAKRAEYTLLLSAAVAFHGLRAEPGITWDTPDDPCTRAFYVSVLDELMAAGFSGEEIIRLATAVRGLASVTEDMLDEAAKAFPQGTTG